MQLFTFYQFRIWWFLLKNFMHISGGVYTSLSMLKLSYTQRGALGMKRAVYDVNNRALALQYGAAGYSCKFTILTPLQTLFVAELIVNTLNRLGFDSEVITSMPQSGFNANWHIVICANVFNTLPQHFFAFQMEQSPSSKWFTKRYIGRLERAAGIMDYSLVNIEFLDRILPGKTTFHVPICNLPIAANIEYPYEYDVLFYGDARNARRRKYLAEIGEFYTVKIIGNIFGEDLRKELQKAKLVINIHYYDNALLETTRIYECLSANTLVISEKSIDFSEHQNLIGMVDFVDIDNVSEMKERIKFWLNNEKERIAHIAQQNKIMGATPSEFDSAFERFLSAHNAIVPIK